MAGPTGPINPKKGGIPPSSDSLADPLIDGGGEASPPFSKGGERGFFTTDTFVPTPPPAAPDAGMAREGHSMFPSDVTVDATAPGTKENPFPITLRAELARKVNDKSARLTEEEIGKIVKAIVAQDSELYPGGSAETMSTAPRYRRRRYRIDDWEFALSTLASRVRQARGLKAGDLKLLRLSTVIKEWLQELFGIEKNIVEVEREIFDLSVDFNDAGQLTEKEVGKIVIAIVAQDTEFYPDGSALPMSTGQKYFRNRHYRIGDWEFSLITLARRVRQARGLKAGDEKRLSNGAIVEGWQKELFGIDRELSGISVILDFDFTDNPTEAEIGSIVRAIVAQDKELYPDGNAVLMSTGKKYLDRRYHIGDWEFSLSVLAARFRKARDLKADDEKLLSDSAIVEGWRRELFGIENEAVEREVFNITVDFEVTENLTEEQIGRIVQTIVAQDQELYPGGSAKPLSTFRKFFLDRRYRIGDWEFALQTLASRVRQARGFSARDTKLLRTSTVVEEWRRQLFAIETAVVEPEVFDIVIEFDLDENMTEEVIGGIVTAIVAQDAELYPAGSVLPMSTYPKYFTERHYRIDNLIFSLRTLATRVRLARGLKLRDTRILSDAAIVRGWKGQLFGITPGPATLEEMEMWIREHNIGEIIELFADDPAMLIEALSFLKAKEFEGRDVAEFVRRYVGLHVERKRTGGGGKDVDRWEKRRIYILAILRALESGEQVDLSDSNFTNQLNLLIRLSRKLFEEDPGRLISELEAEAAKPSHLFVQRLHTEAANYFQATRDFEIKGMRTPAYGYQKEGAHFLATHDKAILADEAGMGKSYQVIAAVETLGLRRVLWVTTAANKETLREEILMHTAEGNNSPRPPLNLRGGDQVKIVISGDPKGRKEQVRGLNGERYVITNYETLVALQKSDPEGYAKLTDGLDVVVVDEAQLTDNPKTLRTNAIHDIPTPRRWLLSATPYQTNPESIWTLLNYLDPERYPDRQAFKQMYTQSTSGLVLLHSELSNIMLRRTKKDTLSFFEPPASGNSPRPPLILRGGESVTDFYAKQLADGIPRLPQKVRVPPEQSGAYELSQEQAELIAWMTADFNGWAEHFNQNLPQNAEPINPDSINPLQKFELIHKVIYDPEYFGITTHSLESPSPFGERVGVRGRAVSENPLFPALDKIVARRLANGEKVILWAWNTAMLDALEARYGRLGTRRIDGTVLGEAREKARHDFQELPEIRLLPANYLSGGVGLTLTAAHSAVFVQIPNQYPLLYQAEGRHQRLIGPENVRHAKDHVEVEWMIPRFPDGFVQNIKDSRLAEILSHGTLVEQTRARLEGGEILYNMVMEGYGDVTALEDYFKEGIIRGMGLTNGEKLDYVAHLEGDVRAYAETIRALMPLWKLVEGTPEAEEKVLQMIEDFRHYPILARRVGEAFQSTSRYYQDDLALITSLFEIKNKYIRTQVLEKLPDLLVKMYGQGQSLAEAAKALKMDRLSPAVFVAQLYLSSGATGQAVANIARELSALRDTPAKRYIEEHFLVGVFGILGKPVAENILRDKEALFDGVKLTERILAVYRLGLLARTRPDLAEQMGSQSFDRWESFQQQLQQAVNQAIAEFAGRTGIHVDEMLEANPAWRGTADSLLALIAAWQEFEDDKLLDQAREVYGHLLDGDLREWRLGENNRVHGNGIDYLSDEPAFWEAFDSNDVTAIDKVVIAPEKVNATLVKDYIAILQEFDQEGEAVEGKWVKEQIDAYRALKGKEVENQRARILENYQNELRLLGPLLRGDGSLASKAELQRKLSELRQLTMWMTLDNRFRELNKGKEVDWKGLVRLLDSKAKYVRSRKHDKMAEHIETLRDMVSARGAGTATFTDVTIEDTDDPAILARMGTLHPEMTNCFNPNGNPTFNQFVLGALGSKNMKMVVVRAGGEVVAAAMMKVKQLEDETPVLFLERGLYRKGYDFRNEMLGHLMKKAEIMGNNSPRPPLNLRGGVMVMDEVRGKSKDIDPLVYGTGAFTENEYVESVFGLRRAANVRHRGRVVEHNSPSASAKATADKQPPLTLRGGERGSYGIGTSNKTIEAYIAELQTNGVTTVVDVRGSPYSRYRPHFNRDRMAASLKSAGVEYVWLGDTLGNPKDEHDERTLDGFRDRHMKTPEYEAGIQRLMEIIRAASGKVAVTCAEGAEADCHRKFILEDVRTRLEANAGGLADTEDYEPMIHTQDALLDEPIEASAGDAEKVQEWSAEAVEGDETISEPLAFGAPDGYSSGMAMGLYGAGAFAMAAPMPALTTALRTSLVL